MAATRSGGAPTGSQTLGHPLRVVAACAAGAAAVIHVSAASDHAGHGRTVTFFLMVAGVQLVMALLLVSRPSDRRVPAGAIVLSLAVVAVWAVSRTAGMPLGPSPTEAEPAGAPDVAAGLLELVVAGVGALLLAPGVAEVPMPGRRTAPWRRALIGSALLLALTPALVADSHHDGAGHHGTGEAAAHHQPGHDGTGATGTDHPQGEPASGHGTHTTGATAAGLGHDLHGAGGWDGAGASHGRHAPAAGTGWSTGAHAHGPSGECVPTPAERAAADELVADTAASLESFTHERALSEGYVPYIAPANWYYHYLNYGYYKSPDIMNPQRPEAIMFAMTDDGYRAIGALYMMPEVGVHGPAIGGCLTHWHAHDSLLIKEPWEAESPAMMHVMTIPLVGGPFSDPSPDEIRNLYGPFRSMVEPWYQDGCAGAPALPVDVYPLLIPGCRDDPILTHTEPG